MSDGSRDIGDLRLATLRGLRWVMLARPVVECVLLGSMVVLAHLVSPADFGHFATASLISGLGAAPVTALSTALVQRTMLEREHLQAANAMALACGAILVGLTLLAAHFVVVPIFGDATANIVRLSAPGAFIGALGAVSFATLQRRLAFRRLSVIDVLGSVSRAAGSVGLALAGLDGAALVLGVLTGALVQTTLAWVSAPPPAPRLHWHPVRDLLHNGMPNWVAAVSWTGFANCDYAIVAARLGAVQAGLYFRAYTVAVEYQKKVSNVMSTVGLPVLARTRSDHDMAALRSQMVSLLTVVLFPCLALLAVVAPVAVPWAFGSRWSAAVGPTQVLAVGGAATLVIDAVGTTLMAAGRSRAVLGFGWAHFLTYATAVFLMSPFGLTGVAAAAAVVHGGFVFVAYGLMHRGAGRTVLRHMWKDVGPAVASCAGLVAASLPVSLAVSSIGVPAVLYLTLVSLAGLCAYAAVLRTCFASTWRMLVTLARRLLPRRRLRGRLVPTPAPVDALAVSAAGDE